MSCIGDDYCLWWNWNADQATVVAGWNEHKHFFTEWKCTTARLLVSFANDPSSGGKASNYDKNKLSAVLDVLASVGVKGVICYWAGFDSYIYGSQQWINNLKLLANDFKGDSRVHSIELANEPYANYLAPNATTLHSFNVAMASAIDQIRAIDQTRKIMYPIVVVILTDSVDSFYNDLVSTGVTAKGNIMYDITHPYYFQDYPKMDVYDNPSDCADWYWNSTILPQIAKFGVQNCWCGETFCWVRGLTPPGGGYNGQIDIDYNMQQTFVVKMINYFVSVGMGFQILDLITSSDQPAQLNALRTSNYVGGGIVTYPCPYGDGFVGNSQAELDVHLLAVHNVDKIVFANKNWTVQTGTWSVTWSVT